MHGRDTSPPRRGKPVLTPRQRRMLLIAVAAVAIVTIGSQALFTGLIIGVRAQGPGEPEVEVLFLAPQAEIDDSFMLRALQLDATLRVHAVDVAFDGNFSRYGVVVLDSARGLNATESASLVQHVNEGGNLVLVSSTNLTGQPDLLVALGIITTGAGVAENTGLASVDAMPAILASPLGKVEWNSIPEVRTYTAIPRASLNATGVTVLLERYLQIDQSGLNQDPLLVQKQLGNGTIIFHAGHLGSANPQLNYQVRVWPYFNYMMYGSAMTLAGKDFPTYGNWAFSPVPHFVEQVVIGVYVFAMVILAIWIFRFVRKRSARTRIDEETLQAATAEAKPEDDTVELPEEKRKFIADLMASGMKPEAIEAELAKIAEVDLTDKWEQVGSHKQIGGFLFGFFMGVVLLIPQLVIVGYLFPQLILPFPQVNGWMDLTRNFFGAIWVAFDVGTSVALAKYFAQYRVKQPEKAIHYVQIFVWWQMLSGVFQIFIVAFIGSIIFPQTYLAHMSWMFVLHSLIQYPGFFLVFQYVFQGMQRTDYQLLTQLLYTIIFNILSQIACILLFRAIFAGMPVYGEAFGAGVGFAFGQYVAEWGTYFFTVGLFKRLKFNVSTIFRADFTWAEFKEALTFGVKFMAGSVWVPAVWLWQVFLQSIFVKGYATEGGYFNLIYTFGGIVAVVGLFMEGLLAGVSEAHSHKKHKLLELHTVQGLKWANYMAFFVVSLLMMMGWRFVLGFSGEEWAPAIRFIPWVLIFQLLGPYSWQGDKMLTGAGLTGKLALCWVIEQVTRALLLLALIPGFQMFGILWAYIPALVAKNVSLWIFIYKYVTRPKAYWVVVWLSPALAAVIVYLLFDFVIAPAIWSASLLPTAILFLIAIFGGLYVYAFLAGVFGHWDKNTLQEFDKASKMVAGVGFFARALYFASRAGYRLCPWRDRFPVDVFNDAMREAHELEIEKKVLKI